jgi:hypothetical protein
MEKVVMDYGGCDEAPHLAVFYDKAGAKREKTGARRVKESNLAEIDANQDSREATSPKEGRTKKLTDRVHRETTPNLRQHSTKIQFQSRTFQWLPERALTVPLKH